MSLDPESIFHDRNYLEFLYSKNRRPETVYPLKLAHFLSKKYFSKSGKRLLDIGCGRVDMLHAFSSLNFLVSGADLSPLSRELISPHPFYQVDFAKDAFPEKDSTFDYVFSKSVIEHMHNPMKLLQESYRILKSDGCAVIMTPSWLHNSWGPFYLDSTHVTPFTRPSLIDAMSLAGFKNVQVFHFYQLPFLWRYRWLTPFVKFVASLPLPYAPMHNVRWPPKLNTFLRFSNEVMLLAVGKKEGLING